MKDNFKEAARALAQKVAAVRTPMSLVFPLFSDLHAAAADAEAVTRLCEMLALITDAVSPDAVVNLGDNLTMLGRRQHITNEKLKATLTALFDRVAEAVKRPVLLINGNHDGVGTDFFKAELWNELTKGKYDAGLARYHTDGCYYYVDFPSSATRLVFLSIPYGSDIEAEHPTPLWAFGKTQLAWLEKVALDTEYDVLLFSHVPFYYEYREDAEAMLEVWNGHDTATSYVGALCGWIEDVEEAVRIIKASGRVKVCLSGHMHDEELWLAGEKRGEDKNPLPCPQYVTTRPVMPETADKTGIAIDVPVWVPEKKQLYIFRFGDGEDRVLFLC